MIRLSLAGLLWGDVAEPPAADRSTAGKPDVIAGSVSIATWCRSSPKRNSHRGGNDRSDQESRLQSRESAGRDRAPDGAASRSRCSPAGTAR